MPWTLRSSTLAPNCRLIFLSISVFKHFRSSRALFTVAPGLHLSAGRDKKNYLWEITYEG